MKHAYLTTAVLVFTLGASFQANAVTQIRTTRQMAVNSCHAARPTFETSLRSRPLGIANEGTETVFISCALPIDEGIGEGATSMRFDFFNRGAATNVSCTAVGDFGTQTQTIGVFLTTNAFNELFFDLNSNSTVADAAAVSCTLPPGVEIIRTTVTETVDVGQ